MKMQVQENISGGIQVVSTDIFSLEIFHFSARLNVFIIRWEKRWTNRKETSFYTFFARDKCRSNILCPAPTCWWAFYWCPHSTVNLSAWGWPCPLASLGRCQWKTVEGGQRRGGKRTDFPLTPPSLDTASLAATVFQQKCSSWPSVASHPNFSVTLFWLHI